MFHAGKASRRLADFDRAKSFLEKAQSFAPKDKSIADELVLLHQDIHKKVEKSATEVVNFISGTYKN